ncbi:hypothetical protein Poli38472_002999 [Pythium oligandrum]|uniref:AVL9/DENND6 domain-containing protein n=1 Tax=Pythium oligandrum TaxID=41045 RepID=A0A8K1FDM6_PYTOL|nr:hypothetical protein Poli38472_002999 [Pythium oligandrum]|eukprot:TMW57074.1 hypothetical protein Poli38472_002999 [Pythium oligandrum]
METSSRFVLAIVRLQRWKPQAQASQETAFDKLYRDEVEFLAGDDGIARKDVLKCGHTLLAALHMTTQSAAALGSSSPTGNLYGEIDDEEDEEEEIFNRELDAIGFRDLSISSSLATASARGDDGVFFELPTTHSSHSTMYGIGVADPRFKQTFYVQQTVRFVILLSNVPFQSYLREKLHELAYDCFADNEHSGPSGHADAPSSPRREVVTSFYQSLQSTIDFTQLPYREIHAGLPIVSLVRWFGKDLIAILRALLLEGRIVCYSTNPGLASSATLALMALVPGVLAMRAEFTSRTIQAVIYRLRRFGMPFALESSAFIVQPCFTNDQEGAIYAANGFLVGTSDPLLLKHSDARLDLIVDLDKRELVTLPTAITEYAFTFGGGTSAFADSLSDRLGRNLADSSSSSPKRSPTRQMIPHLQPSGANPAAAVADAEWVISQFQQYFEHFLEACGPAMFPNEAKETTSGTSTPTRSSSKRELRAASILARLEEFAGPIFSPHAEYYAEYGRNWSHAWQKTENFKQWAEAHRVERRRSTLVTVPPPPDQGRASYTYPNGDEYEGEFLHGKRHGSGIYVEFVTKNQYEGEWRMDQRHGKGVLSATRSGYIYDGMWQEDVRCGYGHSSLRNVEQYTGEWLDNRFHGVGVYSNAEGDVYDGEWRNGVQHGVGKLTISKPPRIGYEPDLGGGLQQYVGEWRDGKFHGTGTAEYADGTQYSGSFQDGKRHGTGLLVYASGDRYEGEWWKGYRHGEGAFYSSTSKITMEGTWKRGNAVDSDDSTWFLTYPNGDKYTGQCKRGRPWGDGVCKYASGASYSGNWVDGLREGFGVLVNPDGSMLEGEWKNSTFVKTVRPPSKFVEISLGGPDSPGAKRKSLLASASSMSFHLFRRDKPLADGSHVVIYPNRDTYDGAFKSNKRHGFGLFTEHSTGNVYEGQWRDNMRHGNGVLTSGMKDFIYDGQWEHDMRQGYGHCVIRGCETYTGDWAANQFHGTGKYIDAEGRVYEGEFHQGKKHGMGKQLVSGANKDHYTGEWKEGYRDGIGVATFEDGSTYSGNWKRDLQDGEGTFTAASGERYSGQWRNGLRDGAGVLFNPSTGVTKEGTWVKDEAIDGDWTIQFPDGSKFTGYCVNGRPHGRGVCKYANGDLYDGNWVNGKRHGLGTGFFANGESFVGEWENNHVALNGKGKLTMADGTVHHYTE